MYPMYEITVGRRMGRKMMVTTVQVVAKDEDEARVGAMNAAREWPSEFEWKEKVEERRR